MTLDPEAELAKLSAKATGWEPGGYPTADIDFRNALVKYYRSGHLRVVREGSVVEGEMLAMLVELLPAHAVDCGVHTAHPSYGNKYCGCKLPALREKLRAMLTAAPQTITDAQESQQEVLSGVVDSSTDRRLKARDESGPDTIPASSVPLTVSAEALEHATETIEGGYTGSAEIMARELLRLAGLRVVREDQEPTEAMLQAAYDADFGTLDTPLRDLYSAIYKAMRAARREGG